MKKYIYLFLLQTVLLINSACEQDLNTYPEDQFTTGNFYQNANDMEAAVNAAYGGLQKEGLYGYNYHILMETRSDNTFEEEPSNSGGYGDIDLFNRVTTNEVIKQTWIDSYVTIQATNIVLNRIDGIEDMDEDTKNIKKGEVKFIRALVYYNLINIYGPVPLVTVETKNPNDYFGQNRTEVSDILVQIIEDLKDASEYLPQINEKDRATKGAANTLLGKVYLFQGDAAKAEAVLREVIGEYTLVNNYSELFGIENENGPASIFEVQFESNVNGDTEGSTFAALFTSQANSGSRGNNIIHQNLIDSFESGDVRRDEIISDVANENLNISTKYLDENRTGSNDGANNVIVLRYADVLLSLAEALNAQQFAADGEAFGLINSIRERAKLPSFMSEEITNQAVFQEMLLRERRHEFFHELHRWFDLKRLGNPVQVMNAHFVTIGKEIDEDDLLLPVPQIQMDSDPSAMTQNPGY